MGDTVEEEEEPNFSQDPNPNPESERETLIFNANNQREILKAIEVVERDSFAIAQSFTSVFASLRLSLSQSTDTSLHHIQCFTDAAGHLQESVLDAATKGNRYINSCLKLNEEMKSIDSLASQLKILRRHVDVLDSAVNKLLHVS
ncbi:hypothetical protein MtrunA17_Chr8g0386911 [Medicago truncatula]|uniref:DUF2365 family protein n=1 Tax=Medicago truncatula TaxID=3880 RepID=I3ST34_MEDTR|nr:uncharacterized protein LOC25502047 [Medicago truncatula]XP_024627488.1 uncharacterized protein LOC25502047 [Medicago truncatula]XP_039685364.1 uncharacterized protein LOC25502047 [Medicago truncatula]AFK43426.1 unknown [Medicago truncatula]KEH21063.1 DUF2365 family protein [Medicago truncatula]RHN43356.1 hypothetical protein MtrunA17_Chr8g0386911 [Medicago truncatula]